MIIIHYDFSDGNEVSYFIGKDLGDNFTTHVLDFFTTDNLAADVIVVKSNGEYISRNELLQNTGEYTSKQIRLEHDIHKMLVANSFNWRKGKSLTSNKSKLNLEELERKVNEALEKETKESIQEWLDKKRSKQYSLS